MKNRKYLLERRRHGTVDFPCAIYLHSEAAGPLLVNHHWHTNMEILHFNGGICHMEIDMEPFTITEESFVFVNPEELHCIRMEGESFRESAIVFDLELLKFAMEDPGQRMLLGPLTQGEKAFPRIIRADSDIGRDLKEEYNRIITIFRKEAETIASHDVLRVKSALLDMVALLEEKNRIDDRIKEKDYRAEYLKIILEYIRTHYGQKIRIGDMAGLVSMNEQYFCRFFKKMLGKTPVEYLNEYRIEKAKEELVYGNDAIMNIALDCGFNHMGNFISVFKKKEGCLPSEYRKCMKMSK